MRRGLGRKPPSVLQPMRRPPKGDYKGPLEYGDDDEEAALVEIADREKSAIDNH